MTFSKLSNALSVSRVRIAQWKQRGLIEFQHETEQGAPRPVDKTDALRLMLVRDFMNENLNLGLIQSLRLTINKLHYEEGTEDFIVLSSGMLWHIVPPTPRGEPGTDVRSTPHNGYVSGVLLCQRVSPKDLPSRLAETERYFSIVISLAAVQARVDEIWGG